MEKVTVYYQSHKTIFQRFGMRKKRVHCAGKEPWDERMFDGQIIHCGLHVNPPEKM